MFVTAEVTFLALLAAHGVREKKRGVVIAAAVLGAILTAGLVVPLDTHIIRVARCLKLTTYASPGWAMARDITRALRVLDPDDPVRYDFSVCHLGMMNACGYGKAHGDRQCPLRGACRPAR